MAAAYAALVSLFNITHQILHPPPIPHYYINIPRNLIESLREEVSSLINFLDEHSSRRSQEIEDLEKRMVDAAHEAEDIIESDVANQIREVMLEMEDLYRKNMSIDMKIFEAMDKIMFVNKGSFGPWFDALHRKFSMRSIEKIDDSLPIHKVMLEKEDMHQGLPKVIEEFISIRKEFDQSKRTDQTSTGASSSRSLPSSNDMSRSLPSGNDIMVGFDEHLKQIMSSLASNEVNLQIVPIVGMGGIGKTTLATNAYKDPYIVEHFQIRAFITVSQEYMVKEIVLELLQQNFSLKNPNELERSADELGTLLHKQLFGRRYLIVLDDMWDMKAWEILKRFFPNNSNGSRILVTTRLLNLAEDFNSCSPYQISLLDEGKSWDLILDKVFGKEECPVELEKIGKSIARRCEGLPLALVVIGGLLAKSDKIKEFWEYVEQNVSSAANLENDEHCIKILRLSYLELPVHLKPCFLYLVVFPKTFEVRTSRLIRLWVAEGFVKGDGGKSLEEMAESYFKDLLDRNLIVVIKRGHDGKVKKFRIHDLIRDLCMREAHKNKFLCIAKLDDPNTSSQLEGVRRMSIHTGTKNKEVCEVLRTTVLNRSILSYTAWESRWCVVKRPNLLRVLDAVDSYSMDEIVLLINSRYITCAILQDLFNSNVSPYISLLWNLQTLVFPAPISLPSEFWLMTQLRHLVMPGITLPDPLDANVVIALEHLQTLLTVKDFVFTEEILRRIPNVKKLGIDYDTSKKVGYFCLSNLVFLDKLESLALAFRGTWENMAFPISLKKLTLSYCEIPWEDMYMVGSLPNLEVLKLKTRAAKGRMWNPNEGEFCRLKVLLISRCKLKIWRADERHFPSLEHLQLKLMRMEEIPMDFAQIQTLQTVDLKYCTFFLILSAMRISMERENLGYDNVQVRSFPSEMYLFELSQMLKAGDVRGFINKVQVITHRNEDEILEYYFLVFSDVFHMIKAFLKLIHRRRQERDH